MALEIREIEVRMRVGDTEALAEDDPSEDSGSPDGETRMNDLVDECVRRVLSALEAKRER